MTTVIGELLEGMRKKGLLKVEDESKNTSNDSLMGLGSAVDKLGMDEDIFEDTKDLDDVFIKNNFVDDPSKAEENSDGSVFNDSLDDDLLKVCEEHEKSLYNDSIKDEKPGNATEDKDFFNGSWEDSFSKFPEDHHAYDLSKENTALGTGEYFAEADHLKKTGKDVAEKAAYEIDYTQADRQKVVNPMEDISHKLGGVS